MNTMQHLYHLIYSFFKTTTEPFDKLDWDGSTLKVIWNENIIEEYSFSDLKALISNF